MEKQFYTDNEVKQLNDFVKGKYDKNMMPNLPYFTKYGDDKNIATESGKQYLKEQKDFYLYSTGQLQ